MKLNIEKIEKHIEAGYISKRKHPVLDLYILNYTPKTQFDWLWDRETISCRGLIVDSEYRIIERPFQKFFTVDQLTQLRNHVHHLWGMKFSAIEDMQFRSFEKMDGSLGVLYWQSFCNGEIDIPYIATRGSFESDQAKKANELLNIIDDSTLVETKWGNKYDMVYNTDSLNRKYTYLFEIIYPENRIVVNYGVEEKLVLIAVIDKETGLDVWAEFDRIRDEGIFPVAKEYPIHTFAELEQASKATIDNFEGYVLVFENGFRLKFKYEEYKRLHRLLTGVNERTVWEMLSAGQDDKEFLEKCPDEFYQWYADVKKRLLEQYGAVYDGLYYYYGYTKSACKGDTRKDFALALKQTEQELNVDGLSGPLFRLYDGKDIKDLVWKAIYPEGSTKVFKIQSADAD